MRARLSSVAAGLLLCASPLLSENPFARFHLGESTNAVRKILGEPTDVADVNPEFRSWQYRVGDIDHDSFSHALIFRNSTGTLVSFSQAFDKPIDVERLFPTAETTFHRYPETGPVEMNVRVRSLPGNRLLLAFGSAKPGDRADQLVLLDRSVLPLFYPWLAKQI